MITKIRFTNFRSHDASELPLRPISLLVGSVAAGKSNILKGFLLIRDTIRLPLVELFPAGLGEFQRNRSWWGGETDPIGFEVELTGVGMDQNSTAVYTLKIADSPGGLYVLEETLQRTDPGSGPLWVFQRHGMRPRSMGEFGDIQPHDPTLLHTVLFKRPLPEEDDTNSAFARSVGMSLINSDYHHLSVSDLKSPGAAQLAQRIGYYGNGLPDFIAWTKFDKNNVVYYEKILEAMRQLLPNLEAIIVTQSQGQRNALAMSFRGQRGYTAASDLSDGTMLTLGLLCLIHRPGRPTLLCIEEPETGLNPRRLRWLFDRLIELAYPRGDEQPTQVIFSSHSPWLIDLFGDMRDSVLLVEQFDGRSRVTPLAKIQGEKLHQTPSPDDSIGYSWATGVYEGL